MLQMRYTEFLFFVSLLFTTFSLISVKILSSGVWTKDTADGARDSASFFFVSSDISCIKRKSVYLDTFQTVPLRIWILNEMFPSKTFHY